MKINHQSHSEKLIGKRKKTELMNNGFSREKGVESDDLDSTTVTEDDAWLLYNFLQSGRTRGSSKST
jgi:hypothetical protein